ncbi:MAG TPA: hypothetical protein VG722_00905, partial [Tepidisphaeraceae bacterium]|nr:hypothetical protein [Tepidisphaeraceae bacterium]
MGFYSNNWLHLTLWGLLGVSIVILYLLRRRFTQPEKELSNLLPAIHRGEVPIDELLKIEGPFNGLATGIHEILRDLRQQ